MAKREEDEWYEAFGYMSPEEQEAVMAEMGYAPQTSLPFEYEGSGLSDYYPLGDIAATPEFTSKGNLDPYDLTQQAKRINVAQDYGSLLLDNILSGIAGPGSYDINAFTPEVEYGKEVTRPGTARLESFAGKGGWEGFLANEILKGGTPSSAMAALQTFLENTDPNDKSISEDERTAYQSLVNSLPRNRDEMTPSQKEAAGFWGDYDYEGLLDTATRYSDEVFKDPAYGYSEEGPDGTMRYWDTAPEEIKTPQMEFFDKYGLPYPTASYEDPQYLEAMLDAEEGTTPEQRASEASRYKQDYVGVVNDRQAAESAYRQQGESDDAMLAAWEASQRPPERTGPRDNPYGLPAASLEAANVAADIDLKRLLEEGTGAPTRDTFLDQAMERARAGGHLPEVRGMLPSAMARDRNASVEAANVAADIDYKNAFEDWQKEQETRLLDEAMLRSATARQQPPQVRTLRDGQISLVGEATTPLPGQGRGFGVVAPGGKNVQPDFNVFRRPEGSTTRPLQASDVDRKARTSRAVKQNDAAVAARQRQRDVEAADPRLNDIKAAAMLHYMGLRGRTPLADAVAQRRAGAARMGL